jgi:capsular polysaccharide biosynthesis protein
MEELDLKELFTIFWNKKTQIILIVAIFMVIGIIYTMGFVTPVYTSSTTLVLATSSNSSNSDTNSITTTDVTLNSKLVSTYSELVKSKNVLRQVKSNLNSDFNEQEMRKNITVTSVKDTEIIEITVIQEDPAYAAKIANEIAKVFTQKVSEIYNINNVHVVDEAEVSSSPSNVNHAKDVVIFAFVGIVVAVMYVLIVNMLDTTVKTQEDIERMLKIPVLANIPYNTPEKGGKR